ncbi:hypothetical protein QVD17_31425 [Tagetes erecta]|uniref:PGG domain-containing protein n=1 Tax=Tagetes erecta TaxID=13708 RepID=A0AAD8K3D4_TARER|nr:hypothetical protein QVD17_31425 [Tagetes erecta]
MEDDTMMKHEHRIDLPITLSGSILYDLYGNRDEYLKLVVPLYEASITGDWETAKTIFDENRDMVRVGLGKSLGTSLHVAVTAKENMFTLNFVKNLVDMMTKDELKLQNKHSNTAFWIASACGKENMVSIMMAKNRDLLHIRGNNELFPLSVGARDGTSGVVKLLYDNSGKMTGDQWKDEDRCSTLYHCIDREFFDVALQMVKDHPKLASDVHLLKILSRKPYAINKVEQNLITRIIKSTCIFFGMELQFKVEDEPDALKLLKIIWNNASRTSMSINETEDMGKILFVAAKMGNTKFVVELLRTYPDLMFEKNREGHTIFHIAVMYRHHGIYNLLYEIGDSTNICVLHDTSGNNMLHLVGKTSKAMAAKTSGASLLMQRELLWFEEVLKIMPPYMTQEKNKHGQTPYELFTIENEEFVSTGLKWMKDCMVVATLIVTVAFAAAFTVPGGNKDDNGLPFFIHQCAFLVFVIANAISLFSSSTSLLVFLSILTARHQQIEFLESLPKKLMIALLALFISVAAMMVTFSASFFVLYHKGLKWVPILVAAFATLPVFMFAVLQFPLLVDMFRSIYDAHYLFKPKTPMLYTRKLRLRSNNSTYRCFSSVIERIVLKIW